MTHKFALNGAVTTWLSGIIGVIGTAQLMTTRVFVQEIVWHRSENGHFLILRVSPGDQQRHDYQGVSSGR